MILPLISSQISIEKYVHKQLICICNFSFIYIYLLVYIYIYMNEKYIWTEWAVFFKETRWYPGVTKTKQNSIFLKI